MAKMWWLNALVFNLEVLEGLECLGHRFSRVPEYDERVRRLRHEPAATAVVSTSVESESRSSAASMLARWMDRKLERVLTLLSFAQARRVIAPYGMVTETNPASPGAFDFSYARSTFAGRTSGVPIVPKHRLGPFLKKAWTTIHDDSSEDRERKWRALGWFLSGNDARFLEHSFLAYWTSVEFLARSHAASLGATRRIDRFPTEEVKACVRQALRKANCAPEEARAIEERAVTLNDRPALDIMARYLSANGIEPDDVASLRPLYKARSMITHGGRAGVDMHVLAGLRAQAYGLGARSLIGELGFKEEFYFGDWTVTAVLYQVRGHERYRAHLASERSKDSGSED